MLKLENPVVDLHMPQGPRFEFACGAWYPGCVLLPSSGTEMCFITGERKRDTLCMRCPVEGFTLSTERLGYLTNRASTFTSLDTTFSNGPVSSIDSVLSVAEEKDHEWGFNFTHAIYPFHGNVLRIGGHCINSKVVEPVDGR